MQFSIFFKLLADRQEKIAALKTHTHIQKKTFTDKD